MRTLEIGYGLFNCLGICLATGCGNEATVSSSRIGNANHNNEMTMSVAASQGAGSLRPGIYTGGEDCESKMEIESLPPFTTVNGGLSSITITAEGYPAIPATVLNAGTSAATGTGGGLELRPGATLTRNFEGRTVVLSVVGYEQLLNGEVVVELTGEATVCGDTCYPIAGTGSNNGICEEAGACGDTESFCYQGNEMVFASCPPGTDCADCRNVLPPVIIEVAQTIRYYHPSPSSLNTETETTWSLTRPVTKTVTTCQSQGVRAPIIINR